MEISGAQLYENVKKIAKSKGYTMNELCAELDMSTNGLKYTFEQKSLKLKILLRMADILGVHPKSLIEEPQSDFTQVEENPATYGNKYTDALERIEDLYKKIERLQEENAGLREELAALQGTDDKKKEAG